MSKPLTQDVPEKCFLLFTPVLMSSSLQDLNTLFILLSLSLELLGECHSSFRAAAQPHRRHWMLDAIATAQALLIRTMVHELLDTDNSGLISKVIILCHLSHAWWHCWGSSLFNLSPPDLLVPEHSSSVCMSPFLNAPQPSESFSRQRADAQFLFVQMATFYQSENLKFLVTVLFTVAPDF